jgi:hypothetical protein
MSEFVIPSSELLDRQTAEEIDKLSSALLKDFGRTLLAAPELLAMVILSRLISA